MLLGSSPAYSGAVLAAVKCRIEQRRMFGKHALGVRAIQAIMSGRLVRAVAPSGASIRIFVDGAAVTAYPGESVLVATLSARDALRQHEFSNEMRAGFC